MECWFEAPCYRKVSSKLLPSGGAETQIVEKAAAVGEAMYLLTGASIAYHYKRLAS